MQNTYKKKIQNVKTKKNMKTKKKNMQKKIYKTKLERINKLNFLK